MATLREIEEYSRLASLPVDDGGQAFREKQEKEAADRLEFNRTMFGKKPQAWSEKMERWEEHKRLVDADWHNFNFFRVSFPATIWAKDPVTGQDRQPGEIDKAEFALEDISIRAYIAVHGPGAPSGLHAEVNVTGGPDGGFIVPQEQAKAILERAGLEWDMQAARVRKLKADTEELLARALDPWKWNNGKIDHSIIDRIEKASAQPEHTSPLYGTKIPKKGGVVGEGVDELLSRAIRYDAGPGSDRSLAYALVVQFKDDPSFKSRMLLLGRALDDQAIYDLFTFQVLYGAYAQDKRNITRLTPVHVPEFLRYGTQEQLEKNLQEELNRNQV